MSAVKGPLEKIGRFVEALIKELVPDLPSYVQDTRDVPHRLDNYVAPPGALLMGIDLESLYTSIPHEWRLRAVYHFLDQKFPLVGAQNEFVVDILKFMLEHNCSQFLGVNYQQIRGTSMVALWAPSYACLHLGLCEEEIVYVSSLYLSCSLMWLRYIDNVLMIWGGSQQELMAFIDELNQNNRNIKLTFSYHLEKLSFLDLTIQIKENTIATKTFRKETADNTLLLATSHHPGSLMRGIPVGQFLRTK